jgi:hypothetical protein
MLQSEQKIIVRNSKSDFRLEFPPNPTQSNPNQPDQIQPQPNQPDQIQPQPNQPKPVQPQPNQPKPIQPQPQPQPNVLQWKKSEKTPHLFPCTKKDVNKAKIRGQFVQDAQIRNGTGSLIGQEKEQMTCAAMQML